MGKTACMFPGQGTQSVGMMQELCQAYPQAGDVFEQAGQILGYDISQLVCEGPIEKLNQTVYTQPAVLTAEVAAFQALRSQGVEPDVLVGFSLGEWAALVAAEVITFEQALRLVALRAQAMQEAVPLGEGGMAVVMGKSKDEVEKLCGELGHYVVPANFNYPGQITVSGVAAGIDELCSRAQNEGFVATPLPISIPSHCELMRPAAQRVEQALSEVEFKDARWPIILAPSGKMTSDAQTIKKNMVEQLTSPVCFEQAVREMFDMDVDLFLEVGPGKTLAGFVRKTAKQVGVKVRSNRTDTLDDFQDAVKLSQRGAQA